MRLILKISLTRLPLVAAPQMSNKEKQFQWNENEAKSVELRGKQN